MSGDHNKYQKGGVVIDKSAAVRIATSIGWQPPQHALMAEHYREHAEGLQRDYDLLLAEFNALKAKQWVGLTVEDIDKSIEDNQRFGGFRKVGFAYDLEEILKEKNT